MDDTTAFEANFKKAVEDAKLALQINRALGDLFIASNLSGNAPTAAGFFKVGYLQGWLAAHGTNLPTSQDPLDADGSDDGTDDAPDHPSAPTSDITNTPMYG